MAGGQLIFQPPLFDWNADDQQLAFDEWKGQITIVSTRKYDLQQL